VARLQRLLEKFVLQEIAWIGFKVFDCPNLRNGGHQVTIGADRGGDFLQSYAGDGVIGAGNVITREGRRN